MDFRILGPLEVISEGQVVELGGAKQRALLAALLLNANAVVSVDRLIDALWEDEPPEGAHKALQVHVYGLRKLVGKHRIQTKSPGYLLRVEEGELDVERFLRLRDEGRLDEALSLWRGPPLSEFAYQRFAQSEAARLEDHRLVCLEERVDQDLRAGRHAELTGELEALVAENPLRERLRGQLMLALYRAGRQADALDAYQDARRVLVEELGIDPGRELRDVHQQILNQDAGLDLAPDASDMPAVDAGSASAAPSAVSRESRKLVTVVCVNVATSAQEGGRLDPEASRRVVGRGFAEARGAIEHHGGTVESVSSGTMTAIFGIPAVHEDDALRAVRAAAGVVSASSELAAEMHSRRVSVEARVGVSTGEVVAGGPLQPTGAPLTDAFGLAHRAADGRILIDEPTVRIVRNAVVVQACAHGFELVEIAAHGGATTVRSPMVGRARERARLRDVYGQAVGDASCQLFTVLGPAGVGKSRLVQEFLDEIESEALVARGRCLSYGEGITYWPLLEAVKELVGLGDDASAEEVKNSVVYALGDTAGAEALAQQVLETIGLAEAQTGVEERFTAVRALFEALARDRPLVLVFDDIHWGEPTFLDLIEHFADWTRDVPVVLACLARPELVELRQGWGGGKLNATSILLEPLSAAESVELIGNLADSDLDEATKQRIVAAAEGNPLFVEEMLALALEEGLPVDQIQIPPTIQALLAARLDQLEPLERAVIDRACVQGKVFYEEAIFALSPSELAPSVGDWLRSLVRKELIRLERTSFGGRTYRFRHILIRDSAYESIPKETRSELHERFARWLDRSASEGAAGYEEIVGYHLEQAYRYRVELGPIDEEATALGRDAAERLAAAGRRAFVRSDAPAGVNLCSRAAALLPLDDPMRVELIPNVRVVQGLGADMSWAEALLTEVVEAAATSGDRRLAAHGLVQRGFLRLFTAADVSPGELIETAQRAAADFTALNDQLGLARSWRLIAQSHYLARRAGPSEEAAAQALVHSRLANDPFEEREIVQWLSVVLFLGPKPAEEAASVCRELLAEVPGQHALEVHILGALSYLVAIQGRTAEAEELAESADRVMQNLGEGWLFPAFAGFEALWHHDPDRAERKLRLGYDALKRVGERAHFCTLASLLARIAYSRRDFAQALALTIEAEESAAANDVHCQILWRSTRGKTLARQGMVEEGERLAREGVAFGATSDFVSSHGDALLDLAEVLQLRGRIDDAAAAARDATILFEQKHNTLGAMRVRNFLAEMNN